MDREVRDVWACLMLATDAPGEVRPMTDNDARLKMISDFYQQEMGATLPDDIAQVLLHLLPEASDRELQGESIRVVAYTSLTGQEFSALVVWDVITRNTERAGALMPRKSQTENVRKICGCAKWKTCAHPRDSRLSAGQGPVS